MKKKRVVFVINSLTIGGIQTALINLLKKIDYNKFDVYLLAFFCDESFKQYIPDKVCIVKVPRILEIINTPSNYIGDKISIRFLLRKVLALLCRVFGANNVYSFLYLFNNVKMHEFDVAISYSNNGSKKSVYFGCNKFVIEKIKATKKIAWLHADYKMMKMNNEINHKEYSCFDKIICVSKDTKKKFIECCPDLKDKTDIIYNVVDIETIVYKALAECPDICVSDKFVISTVCRLDSNKNVQECIEIATVLNKLKFDYRWIIVGDGPEMSKLKEMAKKKNVASNILFVGYRDNPFPYIKNSDLFVSCSKSESFGLSIYESLILGVQVIVRKYDAVNEVVRDANDGVIIDGDMNDFASAIINVANRKRCTTNDSYAMAAEQTNMISMMKFEDILNE